jgi:alpha-glucosidase (family GH31 glycosyl hydrolase)
LIESDGDTEIFQSQQLFSDVILLTSCKINKQMSAQFVIVFAVILLLFSFIRCDGQQQQYYVVEPIQVPKALYSDWAHSHWVWLNKNIQNQTALLQLVNDYTARDIPVGAIDVDSEWSTGINNFQWNTKKFPDAKGMIDQLHSRGVKVICWATSMINTDSSNYQEGKQKGYYLNDGATIKWWHGHGSFLDYSNPDAVDWWHKQLDIPLNDGIDGFKTDGTDPFVVELIFIKGHQGKITEREYANWYYRDFFYYTRQKRGDEGLIMARPVDSYKFIYWSFAPRDVVFSGWVGDQDPTFDGLQTALKNMFHSAWRGYVGFGSDIGGYRSGNRTREVFMRWFQLGAFNALMENGGENEHRPWVFDQLYGTGNETVDTYRKFVHAHHELIPYLMSAGMDAWNGNYSIMKPIAKDTIFTPSTWAYMLGKDIFVTPVVDNSTSTTIEFPTGNDWVDYWDHTITHKGGSKLKHYPVPLTTMPIYKRAGSIIPLNVTRSYLNHGDESSSKYLTLLFEQPRTSEKKLISRFYSEGFEVKYQMVQEQYAMDIWVSAQSQPLILLIRGVEHFNLKMLLRKVDDTFDIFSGDATRTVETKSKNEIVVRLSADQVSKGIEMRLTGLGSYQKQ